MKKHTLFAVDLAKAGFEAPVGDSRQAPQVAVVNTAAVRELLQDTSALGRRFGFSPEERDELEIVGVVRDVKYRNVRDAAPPTFYLPYMQRPVSSMTFELKTLTDPRDLVPSVRQSVSSVDPNVPLMDVSTQSEQIEERLEQERFFALSYTLFGGLAVLLTAVGLFGVASYSVARRTNEIGIRMALGAQRTQVRRMILGELLVLVGVGVALGLVATLAGGRLVANLLFGVAPTHPLTLTVAVGVLLLVSAVAGYLPARRASRVDPMVALQYE